MDPVRAHERRRHLVSGAATSVDIPVSDDEALLELAPNVLLTDPAACQAHLDSLGRLVAASTCFRLETGRDLERIPDLVRELVITVG